MKAEEIFAVAVENRTPSERAAYLDSACGEEAELRAEVEGLLKSHEEAGSFLEQPLFEPAPTLDQAVAERPGQTIGRYQLLEEIGEGGMGVVFRAEQREPVRRTVALKVIKPGMDTRAVVARFEAERQALALMDHPNIAHVLEAGATGSGRPYFVMELVQGVPLTDYCDQNRLTTRARLELFVQVCHAVQHAHQKGIIHRDLKPSNVMVTLYDGVPAPKIIDFGLAKAVNWRLTEKTLFPSCGQTMGTPLYMSPEQAEVSGLDVDTRSDIYSLGVVLYELLTGSTPFDPERVREAGFDEIRRMIREDDPACPSARISTLGPAAMTITAHRQTVPKKLGQVLRRDLDWVVMKALQKDRGRRYQTASDLARDIERYLGDEPVEARPPSLADRAAKWARRHPRMTTVGLMLLAVVVFLGIPGLVWWQQQRAALVKLVETDLEDVRLAMDQDHWPEAWRALERAEGRLGRSGPALLRQRAAQQRGNLDMIGSLEEARLALSQWKDRSFDYESADRAYALAFRDHGLDVAALEPAEVVARIRGSGIARHLVSALDHWAYIRSTLPGQSGAPLRDLAQQADDDPWCQRVREASARKDWPALERLARAPEALDQAPINLFLLAVSLERNSPSRPVVEQLLRRAQGHYPGDFWINFDRGMFLGKGSESSPGQLAEAVGCYRIALALRPMSFAVRNNLGLALFAQGKGAEAMEEFQRAINLNPDLAQAHNNLGSTLKAQDKVTEAIEHFQQAIKIEPKNAAVHNNLGNALYNQGKQVEAIEEFQRAIKLNPDLAMAHYNLGNALTKQRNLAEAIKAYLRAIKLQPDNAMAHNNLGGALYEQGKLAEAIKEFQRAIKLNPDLAMAHNNLGGALTKQRNLAEAIKAYLRAIKLQPDNAEAHNNLGGALYEQGKLAEAIEELQRATKLQPHLAGAHYNLGKVLSDQGKVAEAIAAYRRAIELKPDYSWAHNNLGMVLAGQGKVAEAIAAYHLAIKFKPDYALAHYNLGIELAGQGKLAEAIGAYRRAIKLKPDNALAHQNLGDALSGQRNLAEAIEAYRRAIELNPALASAHNGLAWVLATAPDPQLRQPVEAVRLAQRAVELTPQEGNCWNTLGVAQYRAGDARGAVQALTQSIKLGQEGEASNFFFLAMAHWQTGDKTQARTWYDKGVMVMDKNGPENEEWRRFRAEAARLLGLVEQLPPPVEVKPR